jgi:hypothetical protein
MNAPGMFEKLPVAIYIVEKTNQFSSVENMFLKNNSIYNRFKKIQIV